MSPFVNINVPTRDLLVPYAKQSPNYGWHISITITMFVNTKHRYIVVRGLSGVRFGL